MKLITTLIFCFGLLQTFAQTKYRVYSTQPNQNTFFLKFDGRLVSTLDSADYIGNIQETKEGEGLFNLVETYKNGSKKCFAKIRFYNPYLGVVEGKVLSYFSNGKIESIEDFGHSRRLMGDSFYYYPNGKIKEIVNYKFDDSYKYKKVVKLIADTSGLNLLDEKATGKVLITDFDSTTTSGYYSNGKKKGKWIINNFGKNVKHEEIYRNDILVSGLLIDSKGNQSFYKYIKTKPSFNKKIVEDTYADVQARIDLYKTSLDKKKGIVVIKFDVSEKAVIENIVFLKTLSTENDLRALKLITSKVWIPATHYGKPFHYRNYIMSIYYR